MELPSLVHCCYFVSSFLSFTWRRNMKKDSVSCIICKKKEWSCSLLHVRAYKNSWDLGKVNEIRMLEQHIMYVCAVSVILWVFGRPFVITTFFGMILNLIYIFFVDVIKAKFKTLYITKTLYERLFHVIVQAVFKCLMYSTVDW